MASVGPLLVPGLSKSARMSTARRLNPVFQALYWLVQGFGGAGFSVPFGLLVAGVTVPTALMNLVPK